jgi:3-deoxy-D-manno-octulosonic-acid transferase
MSTTKKFSIGSGLLLKAYDAAMLAAVPLLPRLSPRLEKGHAERKAPSYAETPCDIWIQAASGGEANLANLLVQILPKDKSILTTSCTDQGLDILKKSATGNVRAGYFPYDSPKSMRRTLQKLKPKVVVLLETELWPGLMAACAKLDVPMVLVNGRMTTRSLAGYLAVKQFFRSTAPRHILATSEDSAQRFGLLFGEDRVEVMSNMKFDGVGLADAGTPKDNPLFGILKPGDPFFVFGSIRRQEEEHMRTALGLVRKARPKTNIGLFPRHMERLEHWKQVLTEDGGDWVLRSELKEAPRRGTVILWDVFGELGAAYAFAKAAYVGGALTPQGGQNFLEPLAQGVVPVIGPHWTNFAWIGRELVDEGLVVEAETAEAVADALLKTGSRPKAKGKVKERMRVYIESRQGGTATAVGNILQIAEEKRA